MDHVHTIKISMKVKDAINIDRDSWSIIEELR